MPNENHHSEGAAENVILNEYILADFYYASPKLVNMKHANQLQTVNLLFSGWRGVAQ